MASSSSHGESSRSGKSFQYQVFLSFSGGDVRKTFMDHLYRRLKEAKLRVFLDDHGLEYGEEIQLKLYEAIEQSELSVVTLSPGYANSRWCLDELVKIMECITPLSGQHVLPVFYNVDPTNVRHQSGPYAEGFREDDQRFQADMGRVEKYRRALKQVADIRGFSLNDTNGYEGQLVDFIIKEVKTRVDTRQLFVTQNVVGRDSIVEDISMWLQDGSQDVGVAVIYGIGGIGKTTIAQITYNKNVAKFERCCFLNFPRESRQGQGLTCLLEQLISDVSGEAPVRINNVSTGLMKVKTAVSGKKLLLVLDDVVELGELGDMFKNPEFFQSGSKIIITTRNQALRKVGTSIREFKVSELSNAESTRLFSLHAFGSDQPSEQYMALSKRFIEYCQGLPLALKVLASSLRKEPEELWESQLQKLATRPDNEIQGVLRLSFDSLNDGADKDLFLHIACFFVGMERDDAFIILEGLKLDPEVGFRNLVDRCLVTMDGGGKIMMHQLIQEMGHEVVREEAQRVLGKQSRLWTPDDAYNVLRNDKGTKKVKCLRLDGRALDRTHSSSSTDLVDISTSSFKKMKYLELLQLYDVQLTGSYSEFPKGIKWLLWENCLLESIPSDLQLNELIVLDMQKGHLIHAWEGCKSLEALKVINLSHSLLVDSPDFSGSPSLEQVIFEGCTKLTEIHASVGNLKNLHLLNVNGCTSLQRIPSSTAKSLYAYECPEIDSNFKLETRANMDPDNASYLGYSDLESLGSVDGDGTFGCLKVLFFCCLQHLLLRWRIPSSTAKSSSTNECPERTLKWTKMQIVEIGSNFKLETRANMDPVNGRYLGYSDLESLGSVDGDGTFGCLKGVYQCGLYSVFIVGDHIDKWFPNITHGPELEYTVPSLPSRPIRAFNVCCLYECSHSAVIAKGYLLIKNKSSSSKWSYAPALYPVYLGVEGRQYTWLTHWPVTQQREIKAGDKLQIQFIHDFPYEAPKKYGMHILFEDEEEDNIPVSGSSEEGRRLSVEAWYHNTFRSIDLTSYQSEPGDFCYSDSHIHLIDDHRILNSFQCVLTTLQTTIASGQLPRPPRGTFRHIPVRSNMSLPPQVTRVLGQIPPGRIPTEKFLK